MVVGEHVQMIEDFLSKEMGFVEQEDGMDALASELLDVGADGIEDAGCGGLGFESHGETKLTVEVAFAESRVVAVGESVAGFGETAT